MTTYIQGMDHSYQKRSGDYLTGPQAKRPTDFSSLTPGVDFLTINMNGESVNVLMEDIRVASSMEHGPFASASSFKAPPPNQGQVFSPPHTRNGTGYTPIRQPAPLRNPPPSQFASSAISMPSPSVPFQQQSSQQQLQQLQAQSQQLSSMISSPKPSNSSIVSNSPKLSTPTKSGIDPALVAKINKSSQARFSALHLA